MSDISISSIVPSIPPNPEIISVRRLIGIYTPGIRFATSSEIHPPRRYAIILSIVPPYSKMNFNATIIIKISIRNCSIARNILKSSYEYFYYFFFKV